MARQPNDANLIGFAAIMTLLVGGGLFVASSIKSIFFKVLATDAIATTAVTGKVRYTIIGSILALFGIGTRAKSGKR
jgi:hypothetical protein